MFPSLSTPLEQRSPTPPWFILSFLAVGMISCLIPPSLYYFRISLSAPILLTLLLQAPRYTAGDVAIDFLSGVIMAAAVFKWLDFVVLHIPEKKYWRVPEGNGDGKAGEREKWINPKVDSGEFDSWLQRLGWSISLWCTTRGVSWNWKVKHLKPGVSANYPRLQFVMQCTHRVLYCLLGADFLHSIISGTTYGHAQAVALSNLFSDPLPTRSAIAWLSALEAYCHLQLPYYVFAALTTALGICRPEQWPPIMGSFSKDAWSVRNVWGYCPIFSIPSSLSDNNSLRTVARAKCGMWSRKCWHQQIRRSCTTLCDPVVDILHIPRGTLLRRYTQLYTAFLTTAICHHFGAYLIGRDHGRMYVLWLSQATIIMLEDLVHYLGKRLGFTDNVYTRALGFMWVIVWFSTPFSLPTAAGVVLHAGGAKDPSPVGFADWFPLPQGCDTLWKVMADRAVVFYFIGRALSVLEARRWTHLLYAGGGALGAWSLHLCR